MLAIVAVGFLLAGIVALFVARSADSGARERFDRDAAVYGKGVEAETSALFDQLTSAGAFFAIPPRPSQGATYDYVAQVGLEDSRWLVDLAWAESVFRNETAGFVARERRGGQPDFAIVNAQSSSNREMVVVTRASSPSAEALIGLDLAGFGPIATRVFQDPISRGEPWFTRVTAPVAEIINRSPGDLRVEADNLIGVLPTRNGRDEVTGWLLARINPEQLLSVDGGGQSLRARLEITDPQVGTFNDPIVAETGFDRAPDGSDAAVASRAFRAGGINWKLTLSSREPASALPAVVFIVGASLALLLALLVFASRRTNEVRGRLSESERRLREDSLTGLPNRLGLEESLGQIIASKGSGERAAAMFLDIDRFKLINDSLGHSAGDELLVALSARLKETLRRHDIVGRFGGDEFLIVLNEIEDASDAEAQANRVLAALVPPFELSFGDTQVHASIGIRVVEGEESDPSGVIRDADIAMFAAKRSGEGTRVFDRAMQYAAGERLAVERALIEAVAAGDLRLEYQPIVDGDGVLIAVEGLLRWRHPELGEVPPAHFIPVAEEVGLMPEIGRQVVREAVEQIARWNNRFDTRLQMAVNVTGAELYDAEFPAFLEAELRHHGVSGDQLMLEISEELLLESAATLRDTLARLAETGVGLALDDFGTGRSSLSQAGKLSTVTEFKLDRSLTDAVDSPEGRVIVRAASDLAAGLGQQVVAEGVERSEQRDFLANLGISRFQGFLYSPSVPATQVSSWLADGGRLDAVDPSTNVAESRSPVVLQSSN